MSERSERISRLLTSLESRASYIRSKLGVLVPSQIRSLRLKSNMPRQADLAREAGMHQSRISAFETPGAANLTLETLSRIAAALKTGLVVEFVPFSEMLDWENNFSQDSFNVTRLNEDAAFLEPRRAAVSRGRTRLKRNARRIQSRVIQMPLQGSVSFQLPAARAQMRLRFDMASPQRQAINTIPAPLYNRAGSVPNSLMPRVAIGAGGHYGI